MRWTLPPRKPRPFNGQIRIRTGFLWLPKTCYASAYSADRELRWLERASWVEEYRVPFKTVSSGWRTLHWMPEPQPKP